MDTTPSIPIPDPQGEAQKATGQSDQTVQALLQLLQQSQRPHVQGQAPSVPGGLQQQSTTPPAYMAQGGRAWGPERFMYTLGASLNNMAQMKQQREVAHATNQYTSLMTSLDKYVGPDGKVSPQAYQDPSVMAILGNEKELKKMSKALQVDWLNPSKTTPYGQALAQAIQKRQKQQQARQGLDKFVHGLINKVSKPQVAMTPDQQQGMAQEVGAKTPTTGTMTDQKDAIAALDQINKMQAQSDEMDLKKDQLHATVQEHADALQERYDTLNAQMQEHKDALAEKAISDEQRQQNSQQLMELRKQSIGIQQELATAKLGLAETPKDRQAWVNNTLKDLMQNRATAAKDMGGTLSKLGIGSSKEDFQMYDNQIKQLQSVSSDLIRGKITTQDAMQKIYGGGAPTAGGNTGQQDPLGIFSGAGAPGGGP
jgi:hypothetical protein